MKPGDLVQAASIKNHASDVYRVYDSPFKVVVFEGQVTGNRMIGKVRHGSVGLLIEIVQEYSLVVFPTVTGWIKSHLLEVLQ